ncbi:transporter, partial [Salmonella enterica]|nr:transporter [Salmonella enterica]
MVMTKCSFRHENLMASFSFCIVTYFLLSTWLHLMHSINERVDSTLPSSLLIRILIIISSLSFIVQKKPGVL